ncbi:MAG: MFS transporter [Thermicanus sp.]|nr:MFS transporter [Thermicanus sp.]
MASASILSIFRNRAFLKLFLASFTSNLGSVIGMTAFTFFLLKRYAHMPAYTAITEMMYSLPTLVVFFIVGVAADRMDRQKIAIYANWISAALTLLLLGAVMIGWMPLIFTLLFLRSAVNKFFFPAEAALVQGILTKEEYTMSAGLNQMVQSIFMLFGSGLGLLAFVSIGVEGAILIDAISYIVSALLIRMNRFPESVRLPNGKISWKQIRPAMILKDFGEGFTYILGNRLLFFLILGFFLFGIVNGGFAVMMMYMLKYKLDPAGYEATSVLNGILFGLGILIGSIFSPMLAKKMKLYRLLIMGLFVTGILTVVGGYAPTLAIYLAVLTLASIFIAPINVALGGWLPQIVDPKMMGRVEGWISPLMMLAQTATLGLIALIYPKWISVESLFLMVGGAILIVAVLYALTLPRYAKREEQASQAAETSTETA